MKENRQRVHDIYQKHEYFINMFDGLFNAKHSLLLTNYINTRNAKIAQEISKQMMILASLVFVTCSNQALSEIAYYYEHRFVTYLEFLALKYARDFNMREIDQLKKQSICNLKTARIALIDQQYQASKSQVESELESVEFNESIRI